MRASRPKLFKSMVMPARRSALLSVALISTLTFGFVTTPPEDACLGTWEIEQKTARVQVYKQAGKYFGKIVWLKRPNDPNTSKAKLDRHNSDPALRTRPILGLIMLKNMTYDATEKEWGNGTVYDPNSGLTYDCTMWMPHPKTMKLRGYWGLIYSTSAWTRVE